MSYKTFKMLYEQALSYDTTEAFIAERGWQDWMDAYGEDAEKMVADMETIYTVAHMTIRDMISQVGMTQAAFADRFMVPLRTVQNWAIGQRECPAYVKVMMADFLGLLPVERQ